LFVENEEIVRLASGIGIVAVDGDLSTLVREGKSARERAALVGPAEHQFIAAPAGCGSNIFVTHVVNDYASIESVIQTNCRLASGIDYGQGLVKRLRPLFKSESDIFRSVVRN